MSLCRVSSPASSAGPWGFIRLLSSGPHRRLSRCRRRAGGALVLALAVRPGASAAPDPGDPHSEEAGEEAPPEAGAAKRDGRAFEVHCEGIERASQKWTGVYSCAAAPFSLKRQMNLLPDKYVDEALSLRDEAQQLYRRDTGADLLCYDEGSNGAGIMQCKNWDEGATVSVSSLAGFSRQLASARLALVKGSIKGLSRLLHVPALERPGWRKSGQRDRLRAPQLPGR